MIHVTHQIKKSPEKNSPVTRFSLLFLKDVACVRKLRLLLKYWIKVFDSVLPDDNILIFKKYILCNCMKKCMVNNNKPIEKQSFSNCNHTDASMDYKNYNEQIAFATLVTYNNRTKEGNLIPFSDIIHSIKNNKYINTPKNQRPVIFPSNSSRRPIGDAGWLTWNGFQVIDLDIHNNRLAVIVRDILGEMLSRYHWFVGAGLSSSGAGVHVWTKVTPVADSNKIRSEYLLNFRHKFSAVFCVLKMRAKQIASLYDACRTQNSVPFTVDAISDWLDTAMCKPQQGAYITADSNAVVSSQFRDMPIDYDFSHIVSSPDDETEYNWVELPELRQKFAKLQYYAEIDEGEDDPDSLNTPDGYAYKPSTGTGRYAKYNLVDTSGGKEVKSAKSTCRHYKHKERWQLANTLMVAFKDSNIAFKYLREVCKDTPSPELLGDIRTAALHKKPLSIWAVKELNNVHGFKLRVDDVEDSKLQELVNADNLHTNIYNTNTIMAGAVKKSRSAITSPTSIFENDDESVFLDEITSRQVAASDKPELVEFTLKDGQYLSDIADDLEREFKGISVLEAGAGFGKTEMMKHLPGRTLLVLPYTSVIEAKFKNDPEMADQWLCYYGSSKPKPEAFMDTNKHMVMTVDKFSKLNLFEIEMGGFSRIVIDESHLIFTSSYRPIMSPAMQRIANICHQVPVIMMTGTMTGEILFFPKAKHIRVVREKDSRIKSFKVIRCFDKDVQTIKMCRGIAQAIEDGKHIIMPTNRGTDYFKQIVGLVQNMLNNNNFGRELKTFYYKKSNTGSDDMERINMEKSVGENDIIACTNYLSVGVDICDKYEFTVVFNELWMPQDIEQFTNRIRQNDLYVTIYVPDHDASGLPIDYETVRPMDLSIKPKEMVQIHNIVKTCNDALERNENESRYNPVIHELLRRNAFVRFDENRGRYFFDQTAYKLMSFEKEYGEFIKQLPNILICMQYYGYETDVEFAPNDVTEDQRDILHENIKTCKRIQVTSRTSRTFELLDCINDSNIEFFSKLGDGYYDILRGDESFSHDFLENNIHVEDIEVIESNMKFIGQLYKWFDIPTIKEIYNYCVEKKSNRISKVKLERICKFITLETQRQKHRIDIPIYKFLSESYKWVLANPQTNQSAVDTFINTWTCMYCNNIDGLLVEQVETEDDKKDKGSHIYLKNMRDNFWSLWKVIFDIKKNRKTKDIAIKPYELMWNRKISPFESAMDANLRMILANELVCRLEANEMGVDYNEHAAEVKKKLEAEKLITYATPAPEDQKALDNFKFKQGSRFDLDEVKKEEGFSDDFSYTGFAEADGSANRFEEKQSNQARVLKQEFGRIKEAQNTALNGIVGGNENEHGLYTGHTETIQTGIITVKTEPIETKVKPEPEHKPIEIKSQPKQEDILDKIEDNFAFNENLLHDEQVLKMYEQLEQTVRKSQQKPKTENLGSFDL